VDYKEKTVAEISKLSKDAAKDILTNQEYWNHIGNKCPCEGCVERMATGLDKYYGLLMEENAANKKHIEEQNAVIATTKSELETARADMEKVREELAMVKSSLTKLV
jgi:hypothetical protein